MADFTDCNNAVFTYTNDGQARSETLSFDLNPRQLGNRYFLDVIRGRKTPFATIDEGLTGLKMVSGVVKSSEMGGAPIGII